MRKVKKEVDSFLKETFDDQETEVTQAQVYPVPEAVELPHSRPELPTVEEEESRTDSVLVPNEEEIIDLRARLEECAEERQRQTFSTTASSLATSTDSSLFSHSIQRILEE